MGECDSMQRVSDRGGNHAFWCGIQAAQGGIHLSKHSRWSPWLPALHPLLHSPPPCLACFSPERAEKAQSSLQEQSCKAMSEDDQLQPDLLRGWRWWAASPSSACVCLSSYRAFCLVQAVMHMYSNKRGGICYGSCCNTANIWKWEGIHQCHKRN